MKAGSPVSPVRRSTLQRLTFLPLGSLFPLLASGDSASVLNVLPRVALVVGNGSYRALPALRNPTNDATALAAKLKEFGFTVVLELDSGKVQLETAISEYGKRIARERCVGLFYYAGHGLQLAWRNYLIPVDAKLETAEEVPQHAVDLVSLIDGIRRARNPMNVVILDACRNNPFASGLKSGEGLSQMDAPAGTLLAYATAPGNAASDGEGKNGLYTEHLLREIDTAEAQIEDVFKRVRLNVRRVSRGQQIPWESTSLEENFYFIPPAEIRKASQEELDRLFALELVVWKRAEVKVAAAVRSLEQRMEPLDEAIRELEDYLRRFPSGNFSEIAQSHLDRLLALQGEQKISIVNSPQNPLTKGTAVADTAYRVGDTYNYNVFEPQTGTPLRAPRYRVTAVSGFQVIFNGGIIVTDLLGNTVKSRNGITEGNQYFPAEYVVGKKWSTRYEFQPQPSRGFAVDISMTLTVVGRESVTVPAGTFEAFRVEGEGFGVIHGNYPTGQRTYPSRRQWTYWIAPEKCRRFVLMETSAGLLYNNMRGPERERFELLSFSEKGRLK